MERTKRSDKKYTEPPNFIIPLPMHVCLYLKKMAGQGLHKKSTHQPTSQLMFNCLMSAAEKTHTKKQVLLVINEARRHKQ